MSYGRTRRGAPPHPPPAPHTRAAAQRHPARARGGELTIGRRMSAGTCPQKSRARVGTSWRDMIAGIPEGTLSTARGTCVGTCAGTCAGDVRGDVRGTCTGDVRGGRARGTCQPPARRCAGGGAAPPAARRAGVGAVPASGDVSGTSPGRVRGRARAVSGRVEDVRGTGRVGCVSGVVQRETHVARAPSGDVSTCAGTCQ